MIFLEIPDIPGESQVEAYADQIEVSTWGWNVSNSKTMHKGKGGSASEAFFGDVIVTKGVDSSSHLLGQKCATGTQIPEAFLHCCKLGDDNEVLEYFTIEMKKVVVRSVDFSGAESVSSETISLNFEEFMVKYVGQEDDGTGGAEKEWPWNIAKKTAP